QSNPQVSVQLASQLIAKNVPLFLGPSISAMCGAVSGLLANGPVAYCYSPAIHPPSGSFQFSANPSTGDMASISLHYFRLKHWTNVALLTTTDATGQDFDRQLDAALERPENRSMKLVAREHFSATDVTATAQIVRIKAANPQALIVWSTGTPIATAFR